MSEIPRHTRRSLFDEWVADFTLRDSCTFLEYVERSTDEHGRVLDEYELAEREALQEERELPME